MLRRSLYLLIAFICVVPATHAFVTTILLRHSETGKMVALYGTTSHPDLAEQMLTDAQLFNQMAGRVVHTILTDSSKDLTMMRIFLQLPADAFSDVINSSGGTTKGPKVSRQYAHVSPDLLLLQQKWFSGYARHYAGSCGYYSLPVDPRTFESNAPLSIINHCIMAIDQGIFFSDEYHDFVQNDPVMHVTYNEELMRDYSTTDFFEYLDTINAVVQGLSEESTLALQDLINEWQTSVVDFKASLADIDDVPEEHLYESLRRFLFSEGTPQERANVLEENYVKGIDLLFAKIVFLSKILDDQRDDETVMTIFAGQDLFIHGLHEYLVEHAGYEVDDRISYKSELFVETCPSLGANTEIMLLAIWDDVFTEMLARHMD